MLAIIFFGIYIQNKKIEIPRNNATNNNPSIDVRNVESSYNISSQTPIVEPKEVLTKIEPLSAAASLPITKKYKQTQ